MVLDVAGVEMTDRSFEFEIDNQDMWNVRKSIFAISDIIPGPALTHKATTKKGTLPAISGKQ